MPELAEVEWYRKQWNPGLGKEITAIALHAQKRIFRGTDTRALQRNLKRQCLWRSHRRGKQIRFAYSGNNWLGLHLGMTGKMTVATANFRPGKHDHLVLYQHDCALVFTDSRQFGRVRFQHGKATPEWWNIDIPEINSSEFNQEFLDLFLSRHGKAPIKAVLLMQHGFPGIGNWMADEILWRAGVLPGKRTYRLTNAEREAIFRAAKFVVTKALATTGRNFSDPPKNWLIHQKWKRNGVCPKHRSPLRQATIGGRTTAWCPKCQR